MEKNQRFLVVFNGKNWEAYDRLAVGSEPRAVLFGSRSEVKELCAELNNNWEADIISMENQQDADDEEDMCAA